MKQGKNVLSKTKKVFMFIILFALIIPVYFLSQKIGLDNKLIDKLRGLIKSPLSIQSVSADVPAVTVIDTTGGCDSCGSTCGCGDGDSGSGGSGE